MEQAELLALLERAKAEGWTELDLAGLDLVELPPEIGELTQLQVLILGKFELETGQWKGNQLTTLPPEIGQLKNLTSLSLFNNQLRELPAVLGELKNLTSLNLIGNQLRELPTVLGELKNLTSLDLVGNQLRELSAALGELKNLTELDLHYNQLREFPAVLGELKNLTALDLSMNQLREFPAVLGELKNLTALDLSMNQLREFPVVLGELKNLTSLDLRFNQLREFPVVLGELKNLTSLNLCNNQLREFPAVLGELKNLTSLNLSVNQLSELPAVLGELKNLTSLDLSMNQLREFPAVLGELKNLTALDLSDNQLSELPAVLGELKNLTSLNLYSNQLSDLPAVLGELKNLTSLNLIDNQLREFPAVLGELKNLTALDLSMNQLRELPAVLGELKNLTALDLSDNQLSEFPAVLGELKNLTALDLSDNQLSELPAVLTQLQNLTTLYLSSNQLRELPAVLAQLQNLTELRLNNNQLSQLPDFIRELPKLKKLDLRGNPVRIPPEILGEKNRYEPGDIQPILDFYFNSQRDPKPLYEAKLLIIGEGGAGKTSLAKKLKDESYQIESQEKSTEGIDVLPWEISHLDGTPMRVNIWDFGGQEIYHATHQFFLTKRSLYLLVADERKDDTDFYYWLKVAETFGDNSPLLIIKNEKQDRQCKLDERTLRGEFSNLKESLSTNLETNRGLDTICAKVQQYLSSLDHVQQIIPAHWADIRAVLENYSQSRNVLELRDYFDLCRRNGFSAEADMLAASQFLHDLGICLHFQDVRFLKRILILKPEWATGTIYKILDNQEVRADFGRFNDDTLEQLWDKGDESQMRDELLQLMKEFALCYEIPGCKGRYIAPQLLEKERLDYDWDSTDNLILSYRYTFKPKAIFPQLIVALHEQIEHNCRVWKHGMVITNGPARAEIIEDDRYYEADITIRVSGSNKRRLLTIVGHELDKINRSYERLTTEVLIPCNCSQCKGSQTPHTYSWESLQRRLANGRRTVECDQSYEDVDVRRLIDDIAEPQPRDNLDKMERFEQPNQSQSASPFSPQPTTINIYNRNDNQPMTTNITQNHHGSGDNVAGNKTVNNYHAPQSPEAAQQTIQDLLKQLKINEQTTTAKLQTQVTIQDLEWQQTLWAAFKNAGPELAKSAVGIALASAGLPGAIIAAAFNVVVEGVRGGLEAREALPPGEDNPFGTPTF
ncbi:leucine-rich repeat domain-containing protein [Limnothrix sp. FACHB-881]|uniref:leucine-rich repeat domain-containing protein n=1 Tax=Limnothrix sp. FACHB-881 TaxID=2692819 RepID=UPI001688A513|nr:leucine-rich repeat domain-containing protein [Limnothrix sp. FACHB-881]MBD2635199.1 leucine-rich repeat domain-containing protein [Limnothrix sp. FACHB-881]